MSTPTANNTSCMCRFGILAPVMTAAILVIYPFVFAQPMLDPEQVLARSMQVEDMIDRVPVRLGDWYGEDVPVPTAAEQLLRPTAILSRRYSRIGLDGSLVLCIIHCSDVRDMIGHHPPQCYPNAGWLMESTEAGQITIGEETLPLQAYRFEWHEMGIAVSSRIVFSSFMLPDGTASTSMGQLRETARGWSESTSGVAQLQIVIDGDISVEQARAWAVDILQSLPAEVFQVLGEGRLDSSNGGAA